MFEDELRRKGEKVSRRDFLKSVGVATIVGSGALLGIDTKSVGATTRAPKEFKIACVSFLSGSAAAPFGIPGRNAVEILSEKLNTGDVPSPYKTKGIGDVPISTEFFDEAGGPAKQVELYRRLAGNYDAIIGWISSADGKALTPVVEELNQLTVFADLGTNTIFEELDPNPKFLFRTHAHQVIDSVGATRYTLEMQPDLKTISGINQDYAWGHDNWDTFSGAMEQLKPDVEAVSPQFPKLFAGEYSAEISALLRANPDVIYSSFWGGDTEAFIMQAAARGLFNKSLVAFNCGDTPLPRLGADVPEGIAIGARGPHAALAPDVKLNGYFTHVYKDRYGIRPVYPSYHYSQALLGVKAAYEKAIAANNGKWPTVDQVIEDFEYLTFETPSGTIKLTLGKGHQAIEPMVYGITGPKLVNGERELIKIRKFPAKSVNPPPEMTTPEWLEAGLPTSTK